MKLYLWKFTQLAKRLKNHEKITQDISEIHEYLTSLNPQNSNLTNLELEKTWKNSYYFSQDSQYSSKNRVWYMFKLDGLKLNETRTK